jgi:hypothetical protein
MRPHASIAGLVRELRALMRRRFTAGISATLSSHPDVVVSGTAVTVRARIFAPAEALAEFAPVLRSDEAADFRVRSFDESARGADFRDYVVRLKAGELKPDRTYHLALHPSLHADAIAQCPVHTFSKRTVVVARRRLREKPRETRRGTASRSARRRG